MDKTTNHLTFYHGLHTGNEDSRDTSDNEGQVASSSTATSIPLSDLTTFAASSSGSGSGSTISLSRLMTSETYYVLPSQSWRSVAL